MKEPSQPPGPQVDRGGFQRTQGNPGEPVSRSHIFSSCCSLFDTWHTIIGDAKESSDRRVVLSELLGEVARLPPEQDEEGKQRTIYDLKFWDDLPTFGWELDEDWRPLGHSRDETLPDKEKAVSTFLSVNAFAAQLMRSGPSIFDYHDFYVIVIMREALEYPEWNPDTQIPEALIPGAVAWLSLMGPQIYSWNKEFPYGGKLGDRGRGGPLWNGKHGFCKERWNLWKQRFIELERVLHGDLKEWAREGAARMAEAER